MKPSERQHPDDDIGELLAEKEFGFADGRGAKIGDRAGLHLADDTDGCPLPVRIDCSRSTSATAAAAGLIAPASAARVDEVRPVSFSLTFTAAVDLATFAAGDFAKAVAGVIGSVSTCSRRAYRRRCSPQSSDLGSP
jgi:hypothetical protein